MRQYNVVIQTAFIGDLFLSIPLLKRLKKKFPEHGLILVCKKGLGDFFIKQNIVDQVFEVEKGNAASYNQAARKINQFKNDNLFCLHQSFRSTLFSFKIKAKNKISFKAWYKKMVFDHRVDYPRPWPDVIRQMAILTPLDAELKQVISSKDWTSLNFKNESDHFEKIPEIFQFPDLGLPQTVMAKKQIALFPGSVWATKKWTVEGYAHVAQTLINEGHRVVLMGGPDDRLDAAEIKKRVSEVEDLAGQMSLYDSSLFIRNFDLVICNDSAPAHIAACFQRPVLSVFGPTVLDFGFRPWNDLSQVIEIDQLACRPCGPHGHQQCPLGHHDCMKKIDPKTVSQKALKMLG